MPKSLFCFLLVLGFILPGYMLGQSCSGELGVNIGGLSTWHYVDIIKTARAWDTPGGQALSATSYDSEGWPREDFRTVLMDNRPVPEWGGTIDDPEQHRINYGGTYKGSFHGKAMIINQAGNWNIQNQQYDSNTNLTTFDLVIDPPGSNHGLVIMGFNQTQRTASSALSTGITDLKIIRPGYDPNNHPLWSNELFNLLGGINFSAIRGHGFSGMSAWDIIYPAEVDWAERKRADFALQGGNAVHRESVCWEHYIQLANQSNLDIWVNVPISASQDYVTGLAQLLKDSLDPQLNIYVENDNEIWNTAFPFSNTNTYNADEAANLGISDQENIARRAVELAGWFENVFGQGSINNRIRVILASHAPMRKWWVLPMLNYIDTNFGPPKNYLYGLSRQTYFSSTTDPGVSVPNLLQAAKDNIDAQIGPDPTNDSNRGSWATFAAEWELPGGVTSYEGGPHFPSGGGTTNLANQITANRDPMMGDILRYNYDEAWWEQGGGLAMHFTLTSGYNRYGTWGLTDNPFNAYRNYKYKALEECLEVTGVEDLAEKTMITVYPNPANEVVTVSFSEELFGEVQINVLDIRGRKLLTRNFQPRSGNQDFQVDVSSLVTGVYFLQVNQGGGMYTSNFFVKSI